MFFSHVFHEATVLPCLSAAGHDQWSVGEGTVLHVQCSVYDSRKCYMCPVCRRKMIVVGDGLCSLDHQRDYSLGCDVRDCLL